jgi:hypothetical protein
MNTELLFMVPLYLGRDYLAALIHMIFGLLTAWLIYSHLKVRIDKTYALLGVFIFLSTPIAIKLSTIPYVDLALGFYSTGAVLALLRWSEISPSPQPSPIEGEGKKRVKWLIISAVFAGLAAGTKYNGLFVPLILTLMTLYLSKNSRPLRAFLTFLSISIAVMSPWYIKNAILTGNPFYPLFFNIFGGLEVPGQPTVPVLLKRHLFYGENWFDILLIPIRVFSQGEDDDMQHFDGVLNPVLAVFLPLAFRGKSTDLRYMGLFSIFYFVLVLFTADMQIRFLLPILPLLSIMTVSGIKQLMDVRNARAVVAIAVVLLLSLNVIYLAKYLGAKEPIPYILGKVSRDEYLLKHLRGSGSAKFINDNLPMDARILMIYTGDRGYYIDRDYYYDSHLSGRPIKEALEGSTNPSDVARRIIRGMGVTHIIMDERLFEEFMENNLDERQKALYKAFSKGYLKELHASEGYSLYEVLSENKGQRPIFDIRSVEK